MSGLEIGGLAVAVYLTATLSAIVGMAGGMTLLAIMLQWIDPLVALPVHGAIQLVSNSSRTVIQRKHVAWRIVLPFSLLLLPAGLVGLQLAQSLDRGALRGVIGAFVLGATLLLWWRTRERPEVPEGDSGSEPLASFIASSAALTTPTAPAAPPSASSPALPSPSPGGAADASASAPAAAHPASTEPSATGEPQPVRSRFWRFFLLGGAAGALNTSIGATGPLIAPFYLDLDFTRRQVIGTKAACQTLGHTIKLVVFGAAGFAFAPFLPALALWAAAAVCGSWTGTRILGHVSERWFRRLYLGVLSVLAVRLLAASFWS